MTANMIAQLHQTTDHDSVNCSYISYMYKIYELSWGKTSFITYVDIGNKTVAQDEILLKLNWPLIYVAIFE